MQCSDACSDRCTVNRYPGETARAASPAHQMRIDCSLQAAETAVAFWKSGGRISALAQRALPLAATRTRIRMHRIPKSTSGRKRAPTPGRERIRLRSQQAKPLPVDPNPYPCRWAHSITCAMLPFINQLLPRSRFVSALQVPGPSTF